MIKKLGRLKKPEIVLADRFEWEHGIYYMPTTHGNDPVLTCIRAGDLFEASVINTCQSYIKPGTTVIDVGCNFGQMSIQFSRTVGSAGTVHAIEASSFIVNYLKRSLAENPGCENVVVHHAAAWNQSGEIKHMFIPNEGQDSWGGAGLCANELDERDRNWEEVISLAIDDIPLTSPVSLIKIDVQGSDWHALAGARNTLLRDQPTVIFEYEAGYDNIFGKNLDDYKAFLSEVNYEIIGSVDNNQHDFICRPRQ
jgi:FkbM family methyltransferase